MANTEQALNKAREALEEAANVIAKIKPDGNGNGTIVRARDAIAAIEALAQPSQEPQYPVGCVKDDPQDYGYYVEWSVQPPPAGTLLYATPQPSAPVQAERHVLTDDAWSIGYSMSNVMFNLAQQAGHVLDGDDCATFDKLRKHWDAAASTAPQAEAKEGWKLVPTQITEEMHAAAVRTIQRCTGNDDFPRRVFAAMLAAAPSSQKEGEQG